LELRQLRSSLGVTQENLAVDAGVDRTVISHLERSKHNASIDLLDRLARECERLQENRSSGEFGHNPFIDQDGS
jgi:transcriptional regulator with XRE-family HTH domain